MYLWKVAHFLSSIAISVLQGRGRIGQRGEGKQESLVRDSLFWAFVVLPILFSPPPLPSSLSSLPASPLSLPCPRPSGRGKPPPSQRPQPGGASQALGPHPWPLCWRELRTSALGNLGGLGCPQH